MKNQALFSSKDKSKKLKCRLLQFLFGALRVKEVESSKVKLIHFHHFPLEEALKISVFLSSQ